MSNYNVRVAPLRRIPALLASLGTPPHQVMEAAGFGYSDLGESDERVPYATAAGLIDASAKASGCESFGFRLGRSFSLQQLGLVGRLTCTSENVGAALAGLIENFHLHDSGGIVTLEKTSKLTSLSYRVIAPNRMSVTQVNDMCIACLCLIMRGLCGSGWNPARVDFARKAPRSDDCFREFFRAHVRFGAEKNALMFSNRWLDYPLDPVDPDDRLALAAIAGDLLKSADLGLAMIVRRFLHQRLASGSSDSCQVAEALGIHERTLRRRLERENTSFSQLLDEVRQTTSFHYLSDTDLSIGDIAALLGYGSTDAFDHAFQRWYGLSPLQWRKLSELACGEAAVVDAGLHADDNHG